MIKNMKDATIEEWNEIKYIIGLRSTDGGGSNTDRIKIVYNTFVSNASICRTCPSQLASIMSIIKVRHDLNYQYLEDKYSRTTDIEELNQDENRGRTTGISCKKCGINFKPSHHLTKTCDGCKNK